MARNVNQYYATQCRAISISCDVQMVWESGSTTIVNLSTELDEDGAVAYHRYWPEEGAELYYHFEVRRVILHILFVYSL